MKVARFSAISSVVVLFLLMSMADTHRAAASALLTITPDQIRYGTFYSGTDVEIVAEVPACDGVVLKVERDGHDIVLNRKGRVGFIWLNVAKVTVRGAPDVYIMVSSDDVGNLCSSEERNRLEIGLGTLRGRISFDSEAPLAGHEFEDLLRLKRRMGTYQERVAIHMEAAGEGRRRVEGSVRLPSALPSGRYQAQLYCFRDGTMIEKTSSELSVESVGLPRLEYELAHRHAAVYGVTAILVAMVAGLGTGLVFSSHGGRGRR